MRADSRLLFELDRPRTTKPEPSKKLTRYSLSELDEFGLNTRLIKFSRDHVDDQLINYSRADSAGVVINEQLINSASAIEVYTRLRNVKFGEKCYPEVVDP